MACALEGGITYWCDSVEVVGSYLGEYASEQISRGGTLKLYDCEGRTTYELTKEKLIEGLKLWTKDRSFYNCLYCNGDGCLELDLCNADADVCDSIVQYAIFGELVYC